ncbi:hypothetical protein Fmac_009938 [Flemingia macrophylla]|uniref:Glabrous enhancer-binding protein-like DBD domain-containing protein n=1 Tax=Flemingia macrophylla TaxID=520843 RepID=A0ABD1N1M0_9FABA
MAQQKQKLRPSPLDDPPTASSSEEEEEDQQPQQPSSQQRQPEDEEEEVSSSSSEEASSQEDEEEEDDHLPPPSKNPPPPPPPPTQSQPSSSETDTESGSETESEPEPSPAKVKPLASKPMDQAQTQKPKPQPSPAPPKGLKRPVENNPVTDPKRSKKKPTNSSSSTPAAAASDDEMEEDGKKSGDQAKKARLWREGDELTILKGMVEFTSKTGQDPLKVSNANAFLDFMKKLLHKEVTNTQLKEKVRRLKKKFETTAEKVKSGEAPPKPHDQKFFELSKKVWGGERGSAASVAAANGPVVEKPKSNGSVAKTPTKKKESTSRNVGSARKPKPETKPEQEKLPLLAKESEKMDVDQKPRGGCSSLLLRELCNHKDGVFLDEDVVQRGLELIGESKRAELEEKWRKLRLAEMNLFAERQLLIGEQTRMIVEALQSSNK